MRTSEINSDEVLAWMERSFIVKPEYGIFFWKEAPNNHPRLAGTEAGSFRPNKSKKQYCHIKFNKIAIKRGWLVFLFVNRRWPKECIDHINGDSTNDSILNIREATVTENSWNHKHRARRINLPMGVRLMPGSGRFQARIGFHKKQIHLGTYDKPEEAQTVYLAKRRELYGKFA